VLWNRNEKVGSVRAVEDYGGGPLLDVKLEDGRDVLVPFTLSICKEIDVAAKNIRAELPEGLLDR
jgi:16S rRNA processing protein RimM